MAKLYIFVGPPATGKSTERKRMCSEDMNLVYVNLDELRDQNPTLSEREILEIQRKLVEEHRQNFKDIIIDNTNLNKNTLEHWVNWGKSNKYDVEIRKFGEDIPWQVAVARDSKRPNPVGRSVVVKMYMDAGLFQCPKHDAIIIDLDGTICDLEHRRHYVRGEGKKDWKSFFAELCNDTVNQAVQYVYQMACRSGTIVIFLSGRPSEYRKETEKWLKDHNLDGYFALFMRPFNNKEDDAIIKEQLYRSYVEPYFNVQFVLDDRNRVVNMWRQIGLHCFQVAPGDF